MVFRSKKRPVQEKFFNITGNPALVEILHTSFLDVGARDCQWLNEEREGNHAVDVGKTCHVPGRFPARGREADRRTSSNDKNSLLGFGQTPRILKRYCVVKEEGDPIPEAG